ncbi:ANTAR domain-containing protein [Nakamurella sp.]|uniref:ANTAR domain-containing protein n=1 Tax=Nakamurella sp. TaxID=1869182 RepID=UPI003B3BB31A
MYASVPVAFSDEDLVLGQEVAGWIALAVMNAERTTSTAQDLANVRAAMASRGVIEQAKGILMERLKVSEDGAFTVLSRASQRATIKLRDVAAHLVRTGALPTAG